MTWKSKGLSNESIKYDDDDGSNSYLFVNGVTIYQRKTKDSEITAYPF